MDKQQQRYERFAQLRIAHPEADYEEIMYRIQDEEIEAEEKASHIAMVAAEAEREMEQSFAQWCAA